MSLEEYFVYFPDDVRVVVCQFRGAMSDVISLTGGARQDITNETRRLGLPVPAEMALWTNNTKTLHESAQIFGASQDPAEEVKVYAMELLETSMRELVLPAFPASVLRATPGNAPRFTQLEDHTQRLLLERLGYMLSRLRTLIDDVRHFHRPEKRFLRFSRTDRNAMRGRAFEYLVIDVLRSYGLDARPSTSREDMKEIDVAVRRDSSIDEDRDSAPRRPIDCFDPPRTHEDFPFQMKINSDLVRTALEHIHVISPRRIADNALSASTIGVDANGGEGCFEPAYFDAGEELVRTLAYTSARGKAAGMRTAVADAIERAVATRLDEPEEALRQLPTAVSRFIAEFVRSEMTLMRLLGDNEYYS